MDEDFESVEYHPFFSFSIFSLSFQVGKSTLISAFCEGKSQSFKDPTLSSEVEVR